MLAALHLPELALELLDDGDAVVARLPLRGETLERALGWLTDEVNRHASNALPSVLIPPDYELPQHPIADGAPFGDCERAALLELAAWYSNASAFMSVIENTTEGASPVRVWPHHFDIATLITLDPNETDPEKARSIGFGLSPGDDSYDEPYFYLNPWPFPEAVDLPALEGNALWHTDGWVGAILPAHRIASEETAEQASQVSAYVISALPAVRAVLS